MHHFNAFLLNILVLLNWESRIMVAKGDCDVPKPLSPLIVVIDGRWKLDENETSSYVVHDMETVQFRCASGYELEGPKQITCYGKHFATSFPKCQIKGCPIPIEPLNGYYYGSFIVKGMYPLGSILHAACHEGYRFADRSNEHLFCKMVDVALFWKGSTPICEKIPSCGDPGVPVNGRRVGLSFFAGSKMIFSCNDNFELVGQKIISCLEDEKWNFDRPKCKPKITCTDSFFTTNGKIQSWTKDGDFFVPGDEVEVLCNKGYYVSGGSERAHCHLIDREVESFEIEYDERFPIDKINEPFWDDQLGQCSEIVCVKPKKPQNGFYRNRSSIPNFSNIENVTLFPFDFKIEFLCHSEHRLIGRRFSRCTENGWSLKNVPLCKKVQCRSLLAPPHGWISVNDSRAVDSVLQFGCYSGYTLIGSRSRKCLKSGKWSGKPSICAEDLSECGIIKSEAQVGNHGYERIVSGDKVDHVWPWMAALHLRYPLNRNKDFDFKCGGSLISSQWVLTAAHCLRGKYHDLKEDDVIVELGHTSLANRANSVRLLATRLIIHEDFGKVPFDSDLALIQLNISVQFSLFVRPICLCPSTHLIPSNSILYKPNEEGTALGYGTFIPRSRKMYDDLRQVDLKIRTRKECNDSLSDSSLILSTNMFCAGGEDGKDTCMGDSGGPMMQQLTNLDGVDYWIQVGIVSWAKTEKCGVDGQYGFYTKLSEFISWINVKMLQP